MCVSSIEKYTLKKKKTKTTHYSLRENTKLHGELNRNMLSKRLVKITFSKNVYQYCVSLMVLLYLSCLYHFQSEKKFHRLEKHQKETSWYCKTSLSHFNLCLHVINYHGILCFHFSIFALSNLCYLKITFMLLLLLLRLLLKRD